MISKINVRESNKGGFLLFIILTSWLFWIGDSLKAYFQKTASYEIKAKNRPPMKLSQAKKVVSPACDHSLASLRQRF